MKLLFHSSNSYLDPDVLDVLTDMNISYDKFTYDFRNPGCDKNHDDDFVSFFLKTFDTHIYDAVMSIDYWPPVAYACYKANIKYIAWSYDCPLDIINPKETLILPNVDCYLFDKHQQKEFSDEGFDNVYYMPLGINQNRYKKINSYKKQCDPYRCEVSFIGKLYENSFPYIANTVNEKTKNILNQIISTQRKMPQMYVLDQLLTDNFVSLIDSEMHNNDNEFVDTVTRNKILYALESQIAQIDRITMLNICGLHHKVNFYSNSRSDLLENINCYPYVNYWSEMPWIFAASKININPSLPSIRSGMNLRSFDITACGGFMLMNRQPELDNFFTDGKEMIAYDSIEDFAYKVEYYLSHESERAEIARAGREKCLSAHTMKSRLRDIFITSKLI